MQPKELPEHIMAKVIEWLGAHCSVSHFWQFDETFVVLAKLGDGSATYCLRVFPVGDALELSQDNIIYA